MSEETRAAHVGFSRILGTRAAIALGFSLSLALLLFAGGGAVMEIDPMSVQLALGLAAVLFLPVILTYAELAAGRPGSASAYQISRGYGYNWLTFLVGWLMLAGLGSAASLLCGELARRLDFAFQSIFQVDLDEAWFLVAAVVLGGLNEWLTSDDRWHTRSALAWTGLGIFLVVLVWAVFAHPVEKVGFESNELGLHDLTTVALLGVGLWFVDLLLNHRRQMQRPDATLRRSLVTVWLCTIALSMVAAYLVLRSPSLLVEFWTTKISLGEARLELLILAVSMLFVWLGLTRLLSRTVRLTGAMTQQGFLPTYGTGGRRRLRALISLAMLSTVVVLVARWVPEIGLVAIAASTFLVITILVVFPYARRPARELSEHRRNRLPLHPLFPGLTVVICGGLAFVLPRLSHWSLLVWMAGGLVFYFAYARGRARSVLQEAIVVGEVDEVQTKSAPRVLVGVGDRSQMAELLDLGSAIARDAGAELVVLSILPTADELSMSTLQREAESQWEELDRAVLECNSDGASIVTLVRIAPSIEAGILATASEYDVDVLLLGAEDLPREAPASAVLSGIFAATSRPLVILRGQIEAEATAVVVGTAGGPHAPEALKLGAAIAASTGRNLELVSIVAQAQPQEKAREAIERTLEKAGLDAEVESRVLEAKNIESGLLESSQGKLLILGAAVDRLLKRTVYEGLPMEVGRVRQGATLTVKRAEAAMRFWQRRLWQFLSRVTPNLTIAERSQVYSQMRHSARADVDFYALISLSSAIATFGLLLDSGAVIIGAMLVAPLMSPILAIAQGIVQGNPLMMQRAGASTLKGSSVAIGVATLITAMLPNTLPTSEILARTSPNLLDLGVALAAGAAAVWAVSRASVAAALPGVAIAVALVPPLCVVGYGLGTSDFGIAGGALLLFLTNLAAIILVGAVIFVLLGFRPTRHEREAQARKAAVVAAISVLLLVIPLGYSTVRVSQRSRIESEIRGVLETQTSENFRVRDLAISRDGDGFLVEGTVFAFQGVETERIYQFQEDLEQVAGVPVRVQLAIVPATLTVAGESPASDSLPDDSVLPSEQE